jgi:signal peptidase
MEPTFAEGDIMAVNNHSKPAEGAIIAFHPDGDEDSTMYLHRAVTHVEEGKNWYQDVDRQYTDYDSCDASPACPARSSGWITRGDNESVYDQDRGMTDPVKRDWIRGVVAFIVDR